MKPLRIAITVDPNIPVPPKEYGGIERVVDFVARGFTSRGHEVTLFAHPRSQTAGRLVPYGTPPHCGFYPRLNELRQVGFGLWEMRHSIDAVLSWGRLAALTPILGIRTLPKVQRYCRAIVPWRGVKTAVRLGGKSVHFAGASTNVYRERVQQGKHGGNWSTVFDGVETERYKLTPNVGHNAPLVFLGRLERIKGVHSAIAIARRAQRALVIAGNKVKTQEGLEYFRTEIEPHINGTDVTYVGTVNDAEKNELLGSAAALLMPIEWEEAFGIVMGEAFACGTPVIGFARGSVPEVVRHGVNGYVCRTVAEAASLVESLPLIDRVKVREDCETRFDSSVIVDAYESLLMNMVQISGR
jgi:glycosyltransferase involved in cell wall biosynthesis